MQAFGGAARADVEEGWEDRWREFHRPVRVGPLWVGPPWEEPAADALAVVIDPGRAFGTGAHPTTRLCLELLAELEPRRAARRRLRLRRARDRRRAARLRAGRRARRRPGRGRGDRARTPPRTASTVDARRGRRDRGRRCPPPTSPSRTSRSRRSTRARGRGSRRALVDLRLPRLATSPSSPGYRHVAPARARRLGGRRPASERPLASRRVSAPWRRFSVRFLGCKVSHTDAQAVRERLLADGHGEARRRRRRRRRQHLLRHERGGAKSRKAAARAARTHAPRLRHRLRREPRRRRFAGLPENVVVVARRSEETPASVAGDVGAIGCVQADARLDRVRAFVKIQDGCSFSCAFCVDPARARRHRAAAAPPPCSPRSAAASRRATARSSSPASTSAASATARPATTLPRLVREAGATPGVERLRLSSIEINHVDDELVAALRETPAVARHLHVPLQSGDDGVLRAMGRRYTVATYLRRLEPLAGTST